MEHAHVFARVGARGQHFGDQRQVHREIAAGSHTAERCRDEVDGHAGGHGCQEERQCEQGGRNEHERLPSAEPVRHSAARNARQHQGDRAQQRDLKQRRADGGLRKAKAAHQEKRLIARQREDAPRHQKTRQPRPAEIRRAARVGPVGQGEHLEIQWFAIRRREVAVMQDQQEDTHPNQAHDAGNENCPGQIGQERLHEHRPAQDAKWLGQAGDGGDAAELSRRDLVHQDRVRARPEGC